MRRLNGLTHGGKWGEAMRVVMRWRQQQLGFGLWKVWTEGLKLKTRETWDWECDFDLWESEILRTGRSLRWDWRVKTEACVWNCGRLISISILAVLNFWWFYFCFANLIFAFACKILDACSSQFDSALVFSSSVSSAHLKRTEIYIYIYIGGKTHSWWWKHS